MLLQNIHVFRNLRQNLFQIGLPYVPGKLSVLLIFCVLDSRLHLVHKRPGQQTEIGETNLHISEVDWKGWLQSCKIGSRKSNRRSKFSTINMCKHSAQRTKTHTKLLLQRNPTTKSVLKLPIALMSAGGTVVAITCNKSPSMNPWANWSRRDFSASLNMVAGAIFCRIAKKCKKHPPAWWIAMASFRENGFRICGAVLSWSPINLFNTRVAWAQEKHVEAAHQPKKTLSLHLHWSASLCLGRAQELFGQTTPSILRTWVGSKLDLNILRFKLGPSSSPSYLPRPAGSSSWNHCISHKVPLLCMISAAAD